MDTYKKLTTEEVGDNYHKAVLVMNQSLAKLIGKEVDDPDVLEFGHSMLLAVKWQQEYSMYLAMDIVNKRNTYDGSHGQCELCGRLGCHGSCFK